MRRVSGGVAVFQKWKVYPCDPRMKRMAHGDGWLVRLHPPGARLTPAQLRRIAALAARHGNGLIEISARGNMQLRGVTAEIHAMATGGSSSGMGSGGMTSKLQAAEIAELAGIALAIASGLHNAPIARATDQGIGTLFLPRRKAGARKAWLGGRLRLKGAVVVDAGAARALGKGSSLLAAGIVRTEGEFSRGDAIAIRGEDGTTLAHGLSEYDAAECARLMGTQSAEQADLLGYAPRSAVVHRDQLVLL